GGGAAMDAAKVIALLAHAGAGAPGDVAAFALGGARARSITGAAPIVAIPTTAGTGSELSAGAVISDPAAHVKRTVLHPSLLPRAVIADAAVGRAGNPTVDSASAITARGNRDG